MPEEQTPNTGATTSEITDKVKILVAKRGVIKGKLTKFITFITKDSNQVKLAQISRRITEMQPCLREFEELHMQIHLLDPSQATDEDLTKFENDFYEYLAVADNIVKPAVNKPASQPGTSGSGSGESPRPAESFFIKLPNIELPNFDGAFTEWLTFRDSYLSLINQNTNLNEIQKFHYLRSSLKGDALATIEHLTPSTENYHAAWELITNRYNNNRLMVQHHVRALFSLPTATPKDPTILRQILQSVTSHLKALQSIKRPTNHWDDLLIYLISTKFDYSTTVAWEATLSSELPTMKELTDFLTKRCQMLESLEISKNRQANLNQNSLNKPVRNFQRSSHVSSQAVNRKQKCVICKRNVHPIYQCDIFRSFSVTQRVAEIQRHKLCENCLRPGHTAQNCLSGACKKCNAKHNSLLHPINNEEISQNISDNAPTGNNAIIPGVSTSHFSQAIFKRVILSTAIINVLDNKGSIHKLRALLDGGSESNFLTQHAAQKLGCNIDKINLPVVGINQSVTTINQITNIEVHSNHTAFKKSISCLVIPKITQNIPLVSFNSRIFEIPRNISLADPKFYESRPIDLLIGNELFLNILSVGQIKPKNPKGPILQKTQLGWIIGGEFPAAEPSPTACHLSQNLENQIVKFWEIEQFNNKTPLSVEDQACEQHFKDNTRRNPEGRFMVRLPFKHDAPQLGNSKRVAINRLGSMEKKFEKNPALKMSYSNFLEEYRTLGHLEKVPESEAQTLTDSSSYFLPHHAVFKSDSTTTKLRVVFDGSSRSSNGKSLNDQLFTGPVLQQELFSILLRFRTHQYILTGDLAKMYRQILVDPRDQNYQLIVWRERYDLPVETFRLKTVTYGLACSPFLAIRCLHELARINSEKYPKAAQILTRDFYVDDLITGADTIEETTEIRSTITTLLKSAGFELRKFASNNTAILPSSDEFNQTEQTIALDMQHAKTLGVLWNAKSDQITLSPKLPSCHKITKRGVLSMIARVFDPLGLVSPVTIKAKVILQDIWKLQLDWDESLPIQLHSEWTQFLRMFSDLNKIIIPRKVISSTGYQRIELHGFSDSSLKSYGACVYIRTVYINGRVECNLLCSKNKVAPLKVISIPRLELSAAVLLAQLVAKVKNELHLSFDQTVYWTDSTIVLSWIRLQSSSLKTFVANRISKIQSLTSANEWRHVASGQNPADILSRGLTPNQLNLSSLWWQGPQLLHLNNYFSTTDNSYVPEQDIPEVKAQCCLTINVAQSNNFILERFSSMSKLIRVIAYVLRFSYNLKTRNKPLSGNLSCTELNQAHDCIIKLVQDQAFHEDIHYLKNHGQLPKSSKLHSLHPFIDNNGLLRVGGRLTNSSLKYETKHPLILPKSHFITQLIIESTHSQQLHGGCQTTMAALRRKYWILSCRDAVRKILFRCVKCFRTKPRSDSPLMGDLPATRVTPSRPFSITGIDYAGPIIIKNGHGRTIKTLKSYVAIFVCFATKAVHIELVCDCSSSTFLNALKRFIARRGKPAHLYSDNATNFVGANRELTKLFKDSQFQTSVVTPLANEGISWHFVPPRSPHMGGLWEAAVKSAKTHIKKVIGNTLLNYDEFYTFLTMIEACLNSRPITQVSNDPSDLSALTPGHFLIGDALTAPAEPELTDIPCNRLSRYQLLVKMRQHFWTRWSREYLHQLQQRTKWTASVPSPQEGGLVVLREDNIPPLHWPLGRIEALHPGADGVVRVVSVRTVRGVLKRPVKRVCVLPLPKNTS